MIEITDYDLIIGEIGIERRAQDQQWGGPAHDDAHVGTEWADYIHKQNTLASVQALNPEQFESRMVKVAALAIAAIESSRRKRSAERPDTPETKKKA